MRGESSAGSGVRASAISEHLFKSRCRKAASNKFGTIVRALWPHKPALHLAQRIGCSERAAAFYIAGRRKPSARALAVIVAEIAE